MLANETCSKFELLSAVRRNDVSHVKHFLSVGIDVNSTYQFNRTLLHSAASVNEHLSHKETINLLLKSGANVNAQNHLGETPLHVLVFKSHPKVVELFLKFNPWIDAEDKQGETPLSRVVRYGELETSRILAYRGADVNHRNFEESTPLHWACLNCDQKMIRFLISEGADFNARDLRGNLPLTNYLRFSCRTIRQETVEQEEKLRLLLEFSDLVNNAFNLINAGFDSLTEFTSKAILEQVAKLKVLNLAAHPSFLEAVLQSKPEYLSS